MEGEAYDVMEIGGCTCVGDVDVVSSIVQVLIMKGLVNIANELESDE